MDITRGNMERMTDVFLGTTSAPTLVQVEEFVRKTLNYNLATTLTEPFLTRGNADIPCQAGKEPVSAVSYSLDGMTRETKLYQAKQALKGGADGLDISMDVSAFKSGRYDYVKGDLKSFVDMMEGRIMKMIYFTSLLVEDEQLWIAEMVIESGTPYLKASTGLRSITTTNQVKLIKDHCHDIIKVMIPGGIRTKEDVIAMIEVETEWIAANSAFETIDSSQD